MINTTSYKEKLEVMLEAITAELKTIGIHNPDVAADWEERADDLKADSPDLLDVADRTEEYDERRATVAVLETRYNNIVRALSKIEAGTYGICEVSGEQIEEDRLEANPAARTNKANMDNEANLPK